MTDLCDHRDRVMLCSMVTVIGTDEGLAFKILCRCADRHKIGCDHCKRWKE